MRIISWGECMWGISASCQPYPPQTETGLQRLSNLKRKPFLGTSVHNIQKCQCSDGYPNKVVLYKCVKEICTLKKLSLPMKLVALLARMGSLWSPPPSTTSNFSLKCLWVLSLNIVVLWTKQGVFAGEVLFNPSFMI